MSFESLLVILCNKFKAIRVILLFASSWFCEFGFSALTEFKSKTIGDEMRACLSHLNLDSIGFAYTNRHTLHL